MVFTSMHCVFIFMDTEQVTRWLFARECAIIEPQTLRIEGNSSSDLWELKEILYNVIEPQISGNCMEF